jgi:membrane-associated protease RseP (regulator of RpoE activity)
MNTEGFLIFFGVFWLVLYVYGRVSWMRNKGVEVQPFLLLYRTKRFNQLFDRLAYRYQRGWRIFFDAGVALALGEIAYGAYFFMTNFLALLSRPETAGRVILLIPGVTVGLQTLPFILIALAIVLVAHEGSHGISSRLEQIPVKSSGVFFFLFLPGAFVEPDDEAFKSSRLTSKLRVMAAGSLGNLAVAFVVSILILMLFTGPSGILILRLRQGGPAQIAGMHEWDVIQSIDGTPIRTWEDLQSYMNSVRAGSVLTITTQRGIFQIVARDPQNASRAIIGLESYGSVEYYPVRGGVLKPQYEYNLLATLSWIQNLSIWVAVVNMLPIYPMDGEKFTTAILSRFLPRRANLFRALITGLFLFIFTSNILLSFFRFEFLPLP